MIRIAAAARRALTRLTRAPGRHTQHDDEWDDATFAILRGQPATIPRADVAGAPPWNPAAGWAGGAAPDPETYRDVWAAEHPANVPGTVAETGVVEHFPSARPAVPGTITEEILWLPSGNGPVTVAAPLAPLPPEPKPEPLPAAAPAPAATTGHRPTTTIGSAQSPTGDALTLLDERQQLIDHAAAVIAAAKFDRILGGVMADA